MIFDKHIFPQVNRMKPESCSKTILVNPEKTDKLDIISNDDLDKISN